MALRRAGFWLLALATSAGSWSCGSEIESHAGEPMGECGAVETSYENGSGSHLSECSDIEYPMSPPVFGDHYPSWAAFQTYDFPVPLGYLVHSLEHGAVVFFYDCPDGCADEVSEVQTFIDELPADPLCAAAVKRRVILVPSPGLGTRWAAAAWGYSVRAACFDRAIFQQFYDAHVAQGPENLCNQGAVISEDACH
jgi:hypothetical protein